MKSNVILRNSRAEQYLCAARKNFIAEKFSSSECSSKTIICHFSDIHEDWERFYNVMEMIKYHKPLFSIHTGDLVCCDSGSDTSLFYQEIEKADTPIFNCIGNHETFRGEEVLNSEYVHKRYIAPLKNINTTGKGYYYADFPEKNLRLIVLNCYDNDLLEDYRKRDYEVGQKQCNWLIDVLKDCEEKNLGVIIASHESDEHVIPGSNNFGFCQRCEPWCITEKYTVNVVADIIDAFKNGKHLKRDCILPNSQTEIHIECEFSKKSEFICYMNGHLHGDFVGYLPTHPDQLSLGITCSGCFPAGYHNIGNEVSDLPRIPGTISEDAVNFYVLDRDNRTVSIVRMGASVNDLFEERLVTKLKY